MRITREDYKVYLKYLHRENKVEGPIANFIHQNREDIDKAFKGTNISVVEFPDEEPKKITLYQAFCTEYPFITISEENFNKAYNETHTTNLDHLKDYILAKGLEEEIEL